MSVPFANQSGCREAMPSGLKTHYLTVGSELLKYEMECLGWRLNNEDAARRQFREGVSFVPVEVLESFLDDLLDLRIPDRSLHIERQIRFAGVVLAGIALILLGIALNYFAMGLSYFQSFAFSMLLGLGALFVWHHTYRRSHRRLLFVKILSQEISRRRGRHGDGTAVSLGDVALGRVIPGQKPQSILGRAGGIR